MEIVGGKEDVAGQRLARDPVASRQRRGRAQQQGAAG